MDGAEKFLRNLAEELKPTYGQLGHAVVQTFIRNHYGRWFTPQEMDAVREVLAIQKRLANIIEKYGA